MYGSTTHINRPDYSPAPMQIQKKKKSASDSFHNTMCTRQKKKKTTGEVVWENKTKKNIQYTAEKKKNHNILP